MRVKFVVPETTMELMCTLPTLPAIGTRIILGEELTGIVESVALEMEPIPESKWLDTVDCVAVVKLDRKPEAGETFIPIYDAVSDTYVIRGYRFSGAFFEALCHDPTPGPWIRVIQRHDGQVTVETQGRQ